MKKFTLIDIITMAGIAASILLVLMFASGCSMKFYKKAPADVRQCCDRVSAHTEEMEKFNRYCKVALFLANSENSKEVGSGVRKGARDAVNVCKFVFGVKTDDELVTAGDEQEYYRVRSYILKEPDLNQGWIRPNCDPAEIHCEEF
jgi:hypothetical protein|tara:strand:+ start:1071 stop:1508 length:438 start_codon:yes stop_codon:yes gene_type:complete